jgi:predicted glycosyltransferase
MLNKTEGVTLAKRLLATSEIQSGLKRVKAPCRPDLAIEFITLEDENHWKQLNAEASSCPQGRFAQPLDVI